MNRYAILLISTVFACGGGSSSTGATHDPADPSSASAGTPASMLGNGGAQSETDEGSEAGARAIAFVRTSFDDKAAKVVKAKCDSGRLRLTLDGVLFAFDHDNLEPGGDDVLAQVKAVAVDPYPTAHIVVEGHTDNIGSDAHNNDLSQRRAATVATWMQAHGVEAARLETKGYGKKWPRVPNTSDANRAKNRRVEFVVTDQQAAASCSKNGPLQGEPGAGKPPIIEGQAGGAKGGEPPGTGIRDNREPTKHPITPVAFSYKFNDTTRDHDHACFSFDPKWVNPQTPDMVLLKSEFSEAEGRFLDKCPTENVVASCDRRPGIPQIEWYYAGATEGTLDMRKALCAGGTWTRTGKPANAKMPADTGTYAVVCDTHATDHRCVEIRPDGNKSMLDATKQACTAVHAPQPARCPSQGAAGRCEQQGVITYYYLAPSETMIYKNICENGGGAWSQP